MLKLQYENKFRLELFETALIVIIAIINTRGTFEPQQESVGFVAVNVDVHRQLPGGKTVRIQTRTHV